MDPAQVAETLTRVGLAGQLVVLALLLGCGAWTAARPGAAPVTALAACALVWSRANSRLEGPVLIPVTPEHGLVTADLLVPAMACVALLSLRRRGAGAAAGRRHPEDRQDVVPTRP